MNTAMLERTNLIKVELLTGAVILAACLLALVMEKPAKAAFPGQNGKIVFQRLASANDANAEIYAMNADGSNQTNLTNNTAPDYDPAMSADGTKIAFQSGRDGNMEIYAMNADGTGQTNLTNSPSTSDTAPAWSPYGTQIAFNRGSGGAADQVYVMNADGSGQASLTSTPEANVYPAWSPDGTRIAFTSYRDGNAEIYVMNSDGSNQTRLTNEPATDYLPDWSPDGTRIAFRSDRDGNEEIYTMHDDGSDQRRLTNDTASDYAPVWSPDGTKIAFVSTRASTGTIANGNIYVMNADGSNQTPLTSGSENDNLPSWQPLSSNCAIGEILPPVNDVSSATDEGMSAYKYGSRGVIPAKFRASCNGDPVDTQAEADAHPMTLTLTRLGSIPDQDAIVESTETGSANTGNLFRFDDAADQYIYNIGVKGLARGIYRIAISEANGGGSHVEWFSIK